MSQQPNVFVLSVDSLPYSSFIDASSRLASLVDGVEFTNAIAPASFTSSSMPAMTTGTLTDEIPAWGLPEAGDPIPIAEALSDDYACGLWTDNYLFGSEYNYDRGFSHGNLGQPGTKKRVANYLRESKLEPIFGLFESAYFGLVEPLFELAGQEASFYRHAEELNQNVLEWLNYQSTTAPIFCWVHYMDTHHPYQPPAEYLEDHSFNQHRSRSELGEFTRNAIKSNGDDLTPEEEADLQTAFEACSEYIGDELASFITELQEQGHYNPDSDMIVVTADHGEIVDRSLHGMLGHVPPAFWEDIIRVPLIVGHPEWEQSTDSEQVSLLDLKRLVLDATREGPHITPEDLHRDTTKFVSEWEEVAEDSITTYRGIRSATGEKAFGAKIGDADRLIVSYVDESSDEKVVADADPSTGDLTTFPSWAVKLRETLEQYGRFVEQNSGSDSIQEVDQQHLKDLGYLE